MTYPGQLDSLVGSALWGSVLQTQAAEHAQHVSVGCTAHDQINDPHPK